MSKFILSAFADEIDENLKIQMDVLETYNISHIEMRGVNGKNIVDYTLDEVSEIKKQLDERGFKISAIGSPIGKINITDDFDAHLERFRHTLKIAEILEARYIRMFSFYMPEEEDASKYREEVIRRWQEFLNASRGTEIILLHENEKGIYGDSARRCLDLMETLNSEYVKCTFDPANFVQIDEETYPYAFEILKNHIEYVHIKDALYSDHSVVPAGKGDGKIKEVLTALKKMGYEGFLSLEPHLAGFKGFAALERDASHKQLAQGGPREFDIAYKALNEIIKEVNG